jgi:hypothetical protein
MMRYSVKSKPSEAPDNLRRVYNGAQQYFTEHGKQGLPPSAGPTPPLGLCCQSGGECAPAASHWDTDTWVALGFEVRDTHRYSYQFINDGNAKFTVRANGDLDCDGHYSTFEMYGRVDENGELVGDGQIRRVRHLE